MSSYRLPYREWLWFWLWGTLSPDGPPWACWGWRWSFPRLHTGSRQWSQPGRISLPLPCRSAGCCDGPQAWRCNQSRTALWWGQCLWPKLSGQNTELQKAKLTIQSIHFSPYNVYMHHWNTTLGWNYKQACSKEKRNHHSPSSSGHFLCISSTIVW